MRSSPATHCGRGTSRAESEGRFFSLLCYGGPVTMKSLSWRRDLRRRGFGIVRHATRSTTNERLRSVSYLLPDPFPRQISRRGLSAVEVAVSLVIMAIIMALGAPLLLRARAAARREVCRDHLHTLTMALH